MMTYKKARALQEFPKWARANEIRYKQALATETFLDEDYVICDGNWYLIIATDSLSVIDFRPVKMEKRSGLCGLFQWLIPS